MKKFKCLIFFMLLLVLPACGTAEKYDTNDDDLHLYMISVSLLRKKCAGTQDGLYEIADGQNADLNIIYTDYKTQSRFYLSSDLSGDPSSEESTSYMRDIHSASAIAVGENKNILFVFKTGSPLSVKKYGEKALAAIIAMDFNGENRKRIYTFAANEWMHDQSGIVCDNEDNLYFIESYLSDEGYSEEKNIVKVNISDGEKTNLVSLDNDQRDYIIGAYENNLIIRKLTVPDREKPFYEQFDSRQILIYVYNIVTGEKTDILTYGYNEKLVLCRDETLYILDKTEQSLTSLNIANGREKAIYKTDAEYDDISFGGGFYDNRIFLSRTKGDEYEVFAVDADTGAVFTPVKDPEGEVCRIYGESEDAFYVANGKIFYEKEMTGPENDKYTVTDHRPDMAFIKKSDYWNGTANFTPLTDYVNWN